MKPDARQHGERSKRCVDGAVIASRQRRRDKYAVTKLAAIVTMFKEKTI
jgi:hypothetical protein